MSRSAVSPVLAVFVALTVILGASTAYFAVSPPVQTRTATTTLVSTVGGATTISLQGSSGASLDIAYKQGIGFYLVDGSGMTLYFRTSDDHSSGMSGCMGNCANVWPPFNVQGNMVLPPGLNATSFAAMTRSDGMKQMDYNGWPLYHYSGDSVPGDVKGQGIGGVWFAYALPTPSQSISTTTTDSTSMMVTTSSSSSTHCMGYYC